MSSKFYIQSPSASEISLQSQTQSQTHSEVTQTPSPPPLQVRRQQAPAPLSLSTALSGLSDEDSDDDDLATSLPFPAPLPRSDFLVPGTFDPSAYLSSVVANRYQTLEDLRNELRTRVQTLNTELVELVNAHQEEFVGLGSSLRGGEERVEEVRVGVMGLRRDVDEIRGVVEERERDVEAALAKRRRFRADIEVGRACLDFEDSLGTLERKLALRHGQKIRDDMDDVDDESSDDSADDDDDVDEGQTGPVSDAALSRLGRRIHDLSRVERCAQRAGLTHPFVDGQKGRVSKCRDTLLLDLGPCLKHLRSNPGAVDATRKMQILGFYGELKSAKEAVEMLRGLR